MKTFWRYLLPAAIATSFFACSNNNDSAGGATEGTNGLAIVDKDIAGLSQKGPFVKGSPVTVLELDSATHKQTGRAFRGKVGEKGAFTVNNLNLASNYAILEANGYYWNELTGNKSTAPITLNAVADLSDRENVNINLLTQLEYERVQQLVEKDSMSISEAKKKAKKEILKAFYSDDDFDLEEMNIFGTEKGDALLLAVSIMVMGDNTEAELTELLYNIAMDLQDDGEFNNDSLRVDIADRAAFHLNSSAIRENILSWKMTDSLPDFEQYIANFWNNEYKLGKCGQENEGKIKTNGNKYSAHSTTRFLCEDGSWKDIYYNPEIEYGNITDKRDNRTYRTVKIDDQVWMAENMKFKPEGAKYVYSCYDDVEANCDKYGVLYGMVAAYDACPEGFHVPSEAEWRKLADFVGGDSVASSKLRAVGSWSVTDFPSTKDDKDVYGFSAMPAGVYFFGDLGVSTYFWTSNTIEKNGEVKGAYNVKISDQDGMAFGGNALSTTKISLRCLKDSEE